MDSIKVIDMLRKGIILVVIVAFVVNAANAVEGMWLPIMLKKYNIEQMQAEGFKLSAEDIYDINKASLKDAIVGLVRLSKPFRHFCTGEIVSPEGLVLTNHHCGFGAIQKHSTVENNLLKDGFWAMNKNEELTNEGIGMCLLKRMEDVTAKVLVNIPDGADAYIRDSVIQSNIAIIEEDAIKETHYLAKVKPFFAGNEYYLSVYEIFRDIRLVGAPPSAIGKFGGDTDNWMWPRHTGDFSMFRIYANKDNEPADYNDENIPYKPLMHLPIAIDEIKKDDFTMVMGYPGTTEEYLPSFAINLRANVTNPARIKIRTEVINIMKTGMLTSPEVRIQYSSKVAHKANGWKKRIGENKGLVRLNAIEKKQEQEKLFTDWVNQNEERIKEYGDIFNNYEDLYGQLNEYQFVYAYFNESILGTELIDLAGSYSDLFEYKKESNNEDVEMKIDDLTKKTKNFFKDYHRPTDKKLFVALLSFYYNDVDAKYHPKSFSAIDKKYKGDYEACFINLFEKSMFNNPEKLNNFLNNYSVSKNKKLSSDPVMKLFIESMYVYHNSVSPYLVSIKQDISNLHKTYVKGIRELNSDKIYFPDANSTFRIAYGKVDNYIPSDAVEYKCFTTLQGIMEKDNPDIFDYDVPQRLRDLYKSKNFGEYANSDGTMPVCFTASNHTTGGNSGSPVLNADGHLIGINFDRNWEGTMSDLMYDPEMCRNITLDARYILFIIDKYAGAKHLVNEMTLVKESKQNPQAIKKEKK